MQDISTNPAVGPASRRALSKLAAAAFLVGHALVMGGGQTI